MDNKPLPSTPAIQADTEDSPPALALPVPEILAADAVSSPNPAAVASSGGSPSEPRARGSNPIYKGHEKL